MKPSLTITSQVLSPLFLACPLFRRKQCCSILETQGSLFRVLPSPPNRNWQEQLLSMNRFRSHFQPDPGWGILTGQVQQSIVRSLGDNTLDFYLASSRTTQRTASAIGGSAWRFVLAGI